MTPTGTDHRTLPSVVTTPADLTAATSALLHAAGPSARRAVEDSTGTDDRRPSLGLVPTMGGLHDGHASLVRTAREANDVVVVSIFVNPLQFGDPADLERYPRTLDADLRLLAEAGADVVFAPGLEDMYPGGEPLVRLSAGRMGEVLEGAARPGHFDGMLTVVAKLLNLAMPAVAARYRAYFGEKDAQQLALIRRLVLDLDVPVHIEGVATVRDTDGLALSSRNRFLAPGERPAALALSQALSGLRHAAERGARPDLAAARAAIQAVDGAHLDYLDVVDPSTFRTLTDDDEAWSRPALAVVAARVGSVRLIDNTFLPAAG